MIREVLSRLSGVRRRGEGRYVARCPAHDDRKPSLSVAEAPDGRVLLHCHAGCPYERIADALGLDKIKKDLPLSPKGAKRKILASEGRVKPLRVWRAAARAESHPYLEAKGLPMTATLRVIEAEAVAALGWRPQAGGAALEGRLIVAPYGTTDGVTGVQLIDAARQKTFTPGSRVTGAWWPARKLTGKEPYIVVCEGVAKAIAVAQSLPKWGVVSCGGAANFRATAEALRAAFPGVQLVIAADVETDAGFPSAAAAAEKLNLPLVAPVFSLGGGGKDWDDYYRAYGAESVRSAFMRAVRTPDEATAAARSEDAPAAVIGDRSYIVSDGSDGTAPGVWQVIERDGKAHRRWICSPLTVEALVSDGAEQHGNWVRYRDRRGIWHERALPLALVAHAPDLRRELADWGVNVAPGGAATTALQEYLTMAAPPSSLRIRRRTGWCDGVFVLPGASYATLAARETVLYSMRPDADQTTAGDIDVWRNEIAAPAEHNTLLTVAISAAFAAPLLHLTGVGNFGLHFVGATSQGKTTLLRCSQSVWGDPARGIRSWNATANGIEAAADDANDLLLCLDELREARPHTVAGLIYALFNGVGATRMTRTLDPRPAKRWRVIVLSAGERSLSSLLSQSGQVEDSGMAARLIHLRADGRAHGAFDAVTGDAKTFTRRLNAAAQTHYGHAGRMYLERLTCALDAGADLRRRHLTLASSTFGDASDAMAGRVADAFALLALAGELAAEYGVVPWTVGHATSCVRVAYEEWLSVAPESDMDAAVQAVADFLETYRDGYFTKERADAPVRERYGWILEDDEEELWALLPRAFDKAVAGHDKRRVIARLAHDDLLLAGRSAATVVRRIAGIPRRVIILRHPLRGRGTASALHPPENDAARHKPREANDDEICPF